MCGSVADPDPFDPDTNPTFNFDTDPDSAFQSYTDPDVQYGSESLPFQRDNVPPNPVLFLLHLYFIFLVSGSNRTHTKSILCSILSSK
jgi:hypothetical protein